MKEKITLQSLPELSSKFLDWSKSVSISFGFWHWRPPTVADFASGRNKVFQLVYDNRIIGLGGLYRIDDISKSAEITGMVRSGGRLAFSKPAIAALSSFGFAEMSLHRIFLSFSDDESKLMAAAKSLGYKNDGKLRDYFYRAGRYRDLVMVSLLRHES